MRYMLLLSRITTSTFIRRCQKLLYVAVAYFEKAKEVCHLFIHKFVVRRAAKSLARRVGNVRDFQHVQNASIYNPMNLNKSKRCSEMMFLTSI